MDGHSIRLESEKISAYFERTSLENEDTLNEIGRINIAVREATLNPICRVIFHDDEKPELLGYMRAKSIPQTLFIRVPGQSKQTVYEVLGVELNCDLMESPLGTEDQYVCYDVYVKPYVDPLSLDLIHSET